MGKAVRRHVKQGMMEECGLKEEDQELCDAGPTLQGKI